MQVSANGRFYLEAMSLIGPGRRAGSRRPHLSCLAWVLIADRATTHKFRITQTARRVRHRIKNLESACRLVISHFWASSLADIQDNDWKNTSFWEEGGVRTSQGSPS